MISLPRPSTMLIISMAALFFRRSSAWLCHVDNVTFRLAVNRCWVDHQQIISLPLVDQL